MNNINSEHRINIIKEKIAEIEKLDEDLCLFNSNKPYQQNKKLSLDEIESFEERYEIKLPLDYKNFLNQIGNGYFGILPLKEKPKDDNYPFNNFKKLKKEFQLDNLWKNLNYEQFKNHYKDSNKFVLELIDLDLFRTNFLEEHQELKRQLNFFDEDIFFENDEFLKRLYECYYHLEPQGYVHLMDYGCATRALLIISGKQRNFVWIDDRANHNGIYPERNIRGIQHSFFSWLEERANNYLEELGQKSDKNEK